MEGGICIEKNSENLGFDVRLTLTLILMKNGERAWTGRMCFTVG